MTLFDFGRNNQLSWSQVCSDDCFSCNVGYWLNGRIFGRYVSVFVPWRSYPRQR